jgi:hypothetical protein
MDGSFSLFKLTISDQTNAIDALTKEYVPFLRSLLEHRAVLDDVILSWMMLLCCAVSRCAFRWYVQFYALLFRPYNAIECKQ